MPSSRFARQAFGRVFRPNKLVNCTMIAVSRLLKNKLYCQREAHLAAKADQFEKSSN